MTSLKELDSRLSLIEKNASEKKRRSILVEEEDGPEIPTFSESVLSRIRKEKEKHKLEEEEVLIFDIKKKAREEARKNAIDNTKLLDVVDFVVEFVERLSFYVPSIVNVVGSAFKGEYKLGLAMEIISELFGDMEKLLPDKFLPQLIKHEVDTKFNRKPDSVEGSRHEEKVQETHKQSKKGKRFFFLGDTKKEK